MLGPLQQGQPASMNKPHMELPLTSAGLQHTGWETCAFETPGTACRSMVPASAWCLQRQPYPGMLAPLQHDGNKTHTLCLKMGPLALQAAPVRKAQTASHERTAREVAWPCSSRLGCDCLCSRLALLDKLLCIREDARATSFLHVLTSISCLLGAGTPPQRSCKPLRDKAGPQGNVPSGNERTCF